MSRPGLGGLLAAFVLALGLGLATTVGVAVADGPDETLTTLLKPGLNPAGWTESEADVDAIFEALPRLERVYGWDPDAQWFRWAARDASGQHGDLERLTPGMGLWLDIGGIGPAAWTRPLVVQSGLARLRTGWNYVVWAGPDGAAVAGALSELERDGILVGSASARRYEQSGALPDGLVAPRTLERGSPFWLRVSDAKQWWQLADAPRVEFVGEFTPFRQRELRDMVDEVVDWFINRFGLAVPGLTVRFGAEGADLATECGGYANRTIYLKHPCFSAIAHEYSHALQEHLATVEHKSPAWLVEGVANRWSAQWHEARGDWTYGSHRRMTVIPQAQQTAFSLRSMETYDELLVEGYENLNYSLAHLAADYLAEFAGDDALFTYWAQRPRWSGWESAFQDAFGISTELFYDLFKENRREIAPPHPMVTIMVFDQAEKPVTGIDFVLKNESKSFNVSTDSRGVYSGRIPQGSYAPTIIIDDSVYCMPNLPNHESQNISRYYHMGQGFPSLLFYNIPMEIIISARNIVVNLPFTIIEGCSQIYGTVRGSGYHTIEASIKVEDISTGKIVRDFKTNKEGSFTYGLRKGNYKISSTFNSPCYEEKTVERKIEISMNSDISNRAIDFLIPDTRLCPLVEGIIIGPNLRPLSGVMVRLFGSNFGGSYATSSRPDGTFSIIPSFQLSHPLYGLRLNVGLCSLGWYDSDSGRMSAERPTALISTSGGVAAFIVAHVRSTVCDLAGHFGTVDMFVPTALAP